MKTRNLLFVAIMALGIISVSCSQGGKKETTNVKDNSISEKISAVTIDPAKSKVIWSGTMLGVYTHEGTMNLSKATLDIEDGEISGGSFTADMNSMVATDENYNPEEGSTPEKLVGHLKSADFFDTDNFPTASFRITGSDGSALKGMLTIRGIENEEKVENILIVKENGLIKISGEMTFDRKKYDVSWDSPAKEMVLSDDVELKIELIGK